MYGSLQVVFIDSTLDRFTVIEQILQLYLLSMTTHHINKILIIVPCIFVYCIVIILEEKSHGLSLNIVSNDREQIGSRVSNKILQPM